MNRTRLQRELERLGIDADLLETRGFRPFAEAAGLEIVQTDADGREHRLAPAAAGAWRRMRRAADEDGIAIFAVSGFRGIERQIMIFRRKLDARQTLAQILAVNAPPGYSEHHTGRAVDIGTAGEPLLEPTFGETPAFAWLERHAGEFGFTLSYPEGNAEGYQYEPWHWCYHARHRR